MTRTPLPDALQLVDTADLVLAATSTINARALIRAELAGRGIGRNGEWVGFPRAAKEWTTNTTPKRRAEPRTTSAVSIVTRREGDHIKNGRMQSWRQP